MTFETDSKAQADREAAKTAARGRWRSGPFAAQAVVNNIGLCRSRHIRERLTGGPSHAPA